MVGVKLRVKLRVRVIHHAYEGPHNNREIQEWVFVSICVYVCVCVRVLVQRFPFEFI